MNFKNFVLLAIISNIFNGCSGCSEDSIPDGSGSRSSLSLNSKVPIVETPEDKEERIEAEEYSEEVSKEAVSEMNDLYEKLHEKSRFERVNDEKPKNDFSENSKDVDQKKIEDNQPIEQKRVDTSPNSWEDLTSQVEEHIEKNRESYSTPPKPANLSIYDDIDSSSVYQSDGKPTSSAIGEFPPMPPMMMLETK